MLYGSVTIKMEWSKQLQEIVENTKSKTGFQILLSGKSSRICTTFERPIKLVPGKQYELALKLTLLFRIVLDLSLVLMQKSTKKASIQVSTACTYYVSTLYSYILTLLQTRIKTERWNLLSIHSFQMYLLERRLLKFRRI